MNRNIIRIAAVAALGLVAAQGAIAGPLQNTDNNTVTAFMNDNRDAGGAYVSGTGENQSVAYAGTRPQGVTAEPARLVGSGNNVSVVLPPPTFAPAGNYVAVVEGSGENQSVTYVLRNATPRG
jgi:hypothetical protein